MRWLVDGLNLIGSRPDGWWRDRTGAMRRLVAELAAYAARRGEPVTVVFDGSPRELADGAHEVEVLFAPGPGPGAADEQIARMVGADPGWRVVTSDRALAGRVRAHGAQVESSRAFRRRLDGADA